MWRTENWREEFRGLLGLSWPLIVNNLSIAGIHTADAMMSGRLGAESLAAVAVGGSVWFFGFAFAMGTLMAISPIAARHYGAGNPELIGRYTRQGIYLAIFVGLLIVFIGGRLVGPLLEGVGIDPEFRQLTEDYVHALVLGAPAIFVFLALRFTNEGMGETKPIMYASVLSLVANIFLNYVLMFGHFGAPALGVVGCGYASAITMWLIMITLAFYMKKSPVYRPLQIFARLGSIHLKELKEILVLGVPIAITITAEAGLFNAVSVLM